MKIREKLALCILVAIGCFFCGHAEPYREATAQHDAAGCLTVCPSATYVELSPKGDLCRCWAPSAFTYTFLYPDDPKIRDESRNRWVGGKKAVEACLAKGQAWEPSKDRQQIVCLQPSEPPPVDPLKHTSLGRLHPSDWPRFLPRPAWMQWHVRRRAT